MEYLPGGDLYSLLQNLGSLDESAAKIYSLQIVHALKYLRENGIIHRDIKPDNILISNKGHLKLTDFGLSFIGMFNRQLPVDDQKIESNSYVGTPDYVAPEIILARPHTFTCDLWSLGALIYEMLCGVPPFHRSTESETRQMIVSGQWPKREAIEYHELSDEAIDLISKLLKVNPEERIGAKNIDEIIQHPWFSDVDENAEAPFVPELNSEEDTDYFLCRDKVTELNDSDIMEDMNSDLQKNENSPNFSRKRKVRRRSQSFVEALPFYQNNSNSELGENHNNSDIIDSGDNIFINNNGIPKSEDDIDDDNNMEKVSDDYRLSGFQSMSIKTLAAANIQLSENYKRRRMSSGLISSIMERNDLQQLSGKKLDKNKKTGSFSNHQMDMIQVESILKGNE